MLEVLITALNTKDPSPISDLHDAAVGTGLGDKIAKKQLPGAEDEQGVIEGLAVAISAATLFWEIVTFVLKWRASRKEEQKDPVDLRLEWDDVVVEIKSNS